MGEQEVSRAEEAEERRLFTKKLLLDLRALETLLAAGAIESGRCRMGAEQELFLVDSRRSSRLFGSKKILRCRPLAGCRGSRNLSTLL